MITAAWIIGKVIVTTTLTVLALYSVIIVVLASIPFGIAWGLFWLVVLWLYEAAWLRVIFDLENFND